MTFSPLQTTRDLRRANQQTLLNLIYFHEPVSRSELCELSGLSAATVTNLVTKLMEQGVVTSAGMVESKGGRPRTRLEINLDFGYFIGVEVAETHINSALYDIKLQKLESLHVDVSTDENRPETIGEYIVHSVRELQACAGVSDAMVIAIGIGMPGIVNREGGVSVFAPNWGWRDIPLLNILRRQLNIPIQFDNGMQALALAELWFGAGQGIRNLAAVLMGTGVSAGIIVDCQLFRGVTNSAGEWGHTCVAVDGPPCRCGSRGCLETFIGAPGIIRQLREVEPNHPLLELRSQRAIVEAIHDAAVEADVACVRVLDQVTHYLGVGVANIINLFNPELIVVGGWCGALISEFVFQRLKPAVAAHALSEPMKAVKIVTTHLGGESVVGLGAASLALETFLAGHSPAVDGKEGNSQRHRTGLLSAVRNP